MKYKIAAISVAMALSVNVMADDVNQTKSQEERLDAVESNIEGMQQDMAVLSSSINQLVTLLQTQQAKTASTQALPSTTSGSSDGLEVDDSVLDEFEEIQNTHSITPGLLVDVYVIDDATSKLPTEPEGLLIATLDFNKGGNFNFYEHLEDESTRGAGLNQTIGLHYRGNYQYAANGKHLFSYTHSSERAKVAGYHERQGNCTSTLLLDDEPKITISAPMGNKKGAINSTTKQTVIETGARQGTFGVWFVCDVKWDSYKYIESAYRHVNVEIMAKSPNDRKLALIDPGEFTH
ncbi:hypothetical protein LRP52_46540 [Photobacterium sp. ZSDE20]|uniref:Uncharacterized protein n=1 Tax=Photobacterium pectinilyticum TaxID=2906793 RepID=A0ABT1N8Y9_9GAMM|nr:hypothetical protein [Photobacterium sp. ZSDE20]MCQ1061215.1 hypothetical protein [Photobacterium sp. ZSDE20]MDD1829614.1 hypothetical protein [Photobacterium sp. ZSDE20]